MSRKEKGLVEQNIELSAEFSRYLFDHPEIDEAIPLDAEIILLPEFNAELRNFNFKLGRELEATGNKVVYMKIKRLRPKILSRIEGVSIDLETAV